MIIKNILVLFMCLPSFVLAQTESKSKSNKDLKEWQGLYKLDDSGEELYGLAGAFRHCSRKNSGVVQVVHDKKNKKFILDEFLGDDQFQERLETNLKYQKLNFQILNSPLGIPEMGIQSDRDFFHLPEVVFKYEGPTYLTTNSIQGIHFEKMRDMIRIERKLESPYIYITRRDTRHRNYYREGVFTRCRYQKIDDKEFDSYLRIYNAVRDHEGFIQTQ